MEVIAVRADITRGLWHVDCRVLSAVTMGRDEELEENEGVFCAWSVVSLSGVTGLLLQLKGQDPPHLFLGHLMLIFRSDTIPEGSIPFPSSYQTC